MRGIRLKNKLAAAALAAIFLSGVLVLSLRSPTALAQYLWTDSIEIFQNVNAVYNNIRQMTNNETVKVDVKAYLFSTERMDLLEYYKLSANGTDFIIISQGVVTLSNGTYHGLEQGQRLSFSVEAEGSSSLSNDDMVRVDVKVELWPARDVHDVAVTAVELSKSIVGESFPTNVSVTVQNQGSFTETFDVSVYANSTFIETKTVILSEDDSKEVHFRCNTSGWIRGKYVISATAHAVQNESDTSDNTLANGYMLLTLPGDVDGDKDVDIYDIVHMAGVYTTTSSEPRFDPNSDIDNDGDVDLQDILIAADHYGESW